MIDPTTKEACLSTESVDALAASLKEILDLAFARIQRLEHLTTAAPALVYALIESVEASPKGAVIQRGVTTGQLLKVTHSVLAPMFDEYLRTGVFPEVEAAKAKIALATVDGVRVDGGEGEAT